MRLREPVLAALPWGAALWAAVSGGLVLIKRDDLGPSATIAFAVDAVTSAAAVSPLRQRHAAGWWLLFGPIVAQPVFAAIDLRREPAGLPKAVGRTLGGAVGAMALLALRGEFRVGSPQSAPQP